MTLHRKWITPALAGIFLLISLTGAAMFFHFGTTLGKVLHEWLGWLLVLIAVAHISLNWRPLKHHLKTITGKALVTGFCVISLVAIVPSGNTSVGSEPPFIQPMKALAEQPISMVAELAHLSFSQVQDKLAQSGYSNVQQQQTVSQLTDNDLRQSMNLLGQIFTQVQ
ncbi:DUF4405 domain-containing protein [Maribrevibacterium harenarium]|uniref:DUF4405 domain-containing protein n=1 Tax=Maribrevibacterium harenarium TaxID=2589817 RepID=A0A501X2D3_9GAMM|nr:DUF4405 domain-containing protein [Maribrevibacterium harenarium]TPE54645.1 DUF4405 domain-containing protein [Maribrevibacterium harenarium]